jgi:hypothetical protein
MVTLNQKAQSSSVRYRTEQSDLRLRENPRLKSYGADEGTSSAVMRSKSVQKELGNAIVAHALRAHDGCPRFHSGTSMWGADLGRLPV